MSPCAPVLSPAIWSLDLPNIHCNIIQHILKHPKRPTLKITYECQRLQLKYQSARSKEVTLIILLQTTKKKKPSSLVPSLFLLHYTILIFSSSISHFHITLSSHLKFPREFQIIFTSIKQSNLVIEC